MKRLSLILSSFLLFSVISCKAQDNTKTGPQPTKEPTVYKGVTDNACAVESQKKGNTSQYQLDKKNTIVEKRPQKTRFFS